MTSRESHSPHSGFAYFDASPRTRARGLIPPPPGTVYAPIPDPGIHAPHALPPTQYYFAEPDGRFEPLHEAPPPVHPQLSTVRDGRSLKWHVGYPSHGPYHPLPDDFQNGPATYPPVRTLNIISATFPWKIHVHTNRYKFVTPEDILNAIYEELQKPMASAEYRLLSPRRRQRVARDFEERVRHYTVERYKGFKRIDYLHHDVMFSGLEENEEFVLTEIGYGLNGTKYLVMRMSSR